MSWSTTPVSVGGDSADADLEALVAQGQEGPEVDRALEAGKRAAALLIRSGAVGHPGHTFRVFVGGHVNPDNKPAEGWSNDCINLSISQE